MRYEIEKDGVSKIFDIERKEKGYSIRRIIGEEEREFLIASQNLGKIMNLLVEGKSFDAGVIDHKEYLEVEVVGERHLINVFDPRKKSLILAGSEGAGLIQTQMPGRVIELCVELGQKISKGDIVVIVEAMKMENPLKATRDGIISDIYVQAGDLVEAKAKLVLIGEE